MEGVIKMTIEIGNETGSGMKLKQLAEMFQKYISENRKERAFFQSAHDYLKALNEKDGVSAIELKNKMFSFGQEKFSKDLRDVYQRLRTSITPLIEDLQKLVEHLDEEQKKTTDFFKTIHTEEIHALKQFEQLCLEYNSKEYSLRASIQASAPEIVKLQQSALGIEDNINTANKSHFINSANYFAQYYAQIYYLIQETANKETVFTSLVSGLKYLDNYIRQSEGVIQDWSDGLVQAAMNVDFSTYKKTYSYNLGGFNDFKLGFKKFLNHFFYGNAGRGKALLAELNKFLEKLNWESNNYGSGKSYSDANENNNLDEFLKRVLTELFTGVRFKDKDGNEKEIKELASKITKVDSGLSELKEGFDKLAQELQSTINKKYHFRIGSGGFKNVELVKDDGESIKISQLDKKFFENEDNKSLAKYLIREIEDALEGEEPWENNDKFKSIMKDNKSLFKNFEEEESSSSSIKDIDEIKKNIKSLIIQIGAEIQTHNFDRASNLMSNLYLLLFNKSEHDYDSFRKLVAKARNAKKFNEINANIQKLAEDVISFAKVSSTPSISAENFSRYEEFLSSLKQIFNI